MPWPDSYCPSNPESYKILFDIMDEYIDALQPKRVHIGHDEWRSDAFCPLLQRQGHGQALRRGRDQDLPAPEGEGARDLDVGRPLRRLAQRSGRVWSEGGPVRYEKPGTAGAREIVAAETNDIHITNWSGAGAAATSPSRSSAGRSSSATCTASAKRTGPGASRRAGLLGGEVSSLVRARRVPARQAQYPRGRVQHQPPLVEALTPSARYAMEEVARLSSRGCAARLAAVPPPVHEGDARCASRCFDIRSRVQPPAEGRGLGPLGRRAGRRLLQPRAVPDRRPAQQRRQLGRRGLAPRRATAAHGGGAARIGAVAQSLIFFQSATATAARTIHAGDADALPARGERAHRLLRDPLRRRPRDHAPDPLRRERAPRGTRASTRYCTTREPSPRASSPTGARPSSGAASGLTRARTCRSSRCAWWARRALPTRCRCCSG